MKTLSPACEINERLAVKDQLLRTGSLADAAAEKDELAKLFKRGGHPETNCLRRTVQRWWNKI